MRNITNYASIENMFEDAQELVRLIIIAKDFTDEDLEHYFGEMSKLRLEEGDEYWTLYHVVKLEAKRRLGATELRKVAT